MINSNLQSKLKTTIDRNTMSNKVIYLKSLFKEFKPDNKIEKIIKDSIFEANGLTEEGQKDNVKDSREFILKNTEEFLHYAVDYSMYDKFQDYT